MNRKRALVALGIALGLVLSGCSSSTDAAGGGSSASSPRPSSSPAGTESGAADPVAVRIQINGDRLDAFAADGSIVAHFAYADDGATTVTGLKAVIGEAPEVETTTTTTVCEAPHHTAKWGDALEVSWNVSTGGYSGIHVSSQEPNSGSLAVESPNGFAVGDSMTALTAGIPGAYTDTRATADQGTTTVWYGVKSGLGAVATDDHGDGIVSVINAPWSADGGDC
ncbi:hypothetical protein BH09ACT1_BH09ACT1_21940 [soil metagenome]